MTKSLPLFLLTTSLLCTACTSSPNSTPTPEPVEPKVEQLSDSNVTTINTSNGIIEIEPTIVATDDSTLMGDQPFDDTVYYYDPIESFNRSIFQLNHFTYTYLFIPVAKGYNFVLPDPVKQSVANVFDNIREPLNLVNNVFSGEFGHAGNNFARFLINSTVGLVGLFDPAEAWFDIKAQPRNVAQMLRHHKVSSGAYLVLPFLGQSDLRNTASIITEGLVHPTKYVLSSPDDTHARILGGVTDFAERAELYQTLYQQADDPYVYFRNQYIQARNRDEIDARQETITTGTTVEPATNTITKEKENNNE
ncbi:VacJ family lipoprotein [Thalassotalea sp. 1_MG-2023]|uniref:MlaA family lipoprotein n=1 Tax=Thalassotalea sp. 1_MG-2023 TaxID=3062680 RepID=UPI0026E203FC|nr:VacJ family lipoprotein [Thalassotalea sp. 1_MG-2023]MDO6428563.1 VacJ family lipoprotein [Thalassotalea sp. 1_MG-2023]